MSVLIYNFGRTLCQRKRVILWLKKLILFAVFLVFAGIVVAFAFKWNYVGDDTVSDATVSLQYITSSKADTASDDDADDSGVTVTGKININTATLDELDALPGIGPSKAEAIIKYRETESRFNSIEDIMNVSGIGEKTYEKLKDHITTE